MLIAAAATGVSRVRYAGATAHAALLRAGGQVQRLEGFERSPYFSAGGELVCAAETPVPMHTRKFVVLNWKPGGAGRFVLDDCVIWNPPALHPGSGSVAALSSGCERLLDALALIGEPKGFARVFAGLDGNSLLARAAGDARQFASACHAGDRVAMVDSASRLLGLGEGFTPSGDDFIGGALFGARVTHAMSHLRADFNAAARAVVESSRSRTHMISATLLRDHADGESFEPMHRLVRSLAEARDWENVMARARDLVAIGHSSGWDMLAGLVAGVTGKTGKCGWR